jgi:voltage-gated potassium channel Kch
MISFFLTLYRLIRVVRACWHDAEFRALLVLFGLILAGATTFYTRVEGWSVLDALYFSVVTAATVGYGDFTPQTAWGKLFTIVYLAVGVGLFVALAGKLALVVIRPQALAAGQERHPNCCDDAPSGSSTSSDAYGEQSG